VGGNWSHSGSLSLFSVADGQGLIKMTAGSSSAANLASVNAPQADLRTTVSLDKIPVGGPLYLSVFGRRIPAVGSYVGKVIIRPNGTFTIEVTRLLSGTPEVVLQPAVTVPGTYSLGDALNIRLQVLGSAPTTIRAKVWEVGTAEPAAWQRSVTDNTSSLQTGGSVGISPYLSSGATNAPITLRIDELAATQP
jgi:hypothetical protein